MEKSIYIQIIASNGEIIDTKKRANRGPNKGACGQSYKGKLLGYTYAVGIYSMHYDVQNDCMRIDEILMGMDEIRQKTRNYFRKKRFMFVVNDSENVTFFEFLASRHIELILMNASLNTNSRTGLCFRDVKNFSGTLATAAGFFKSIPIQEFIDGFRTMQNEIDSNFNLGNYCEFCLSGKISDINAGRFEQKKQDVFLHGFRYELKTSLSIEQIKDKSKSNTNFFCILD